ncbi:MAG: hypothetical protein AB8I08_06340 [Sandaracinaceae bacterium]
MPRLLRPLAAALLLACSPETATLLVELQTDYIPGQEFDRVTVVVESGSGIVAERSMPIGVEVDARQSTRIAEIEALPTGRMFITVELRTGPSLRATRRIAVNHPGGALLATALISRDCAGVMCPGETGSATLTQCLGGRCVEEGCTPETPELCPSPECESDAECASTVDCVASECVAGTCLDFPNDDACDEGESCRPELGCRPDAGSCASDFACDLFDTTCVGFLGRRCAALGLLDDGRMELVIYDADTGGTCEAQSIDARPGALSGTPQRFGAGLVWASGCNGFHLSFDTGLATLEPSPCGLPSPTQDGQLAWVEQTAAGEGVVHRPDGSDVPFTTAAGWGRLTSVAPGVAALDVQEDQWDLLDLNSGALTGVIVPPSAEPAQGVVRDGSEYLWLMDGINPAVVRAMADGTELSRTPIPGLPPLGVDARWVGVGCAF